MKSLLEGIAIGVVAAVSLGLIVWMMIAYSGIYNVSASEPHSDPVRWTLDTTMHRSVEVRADATSLPESFTQQQISEGARHYARSCAHCHGVPGGEPAAWSRGMRPEPPHLVEAAAEWSPAEIHWIVENGIRMTGMPAFGSAHSAEEIMAITAFVSALPGLTAEDYAALAGDQPQDERTPNAEPAEAAGSVSE